MASRTAEITIDRTPDDVWAVAGDFAGIGWMPGVESVRMDGDDVRVIGLMGMEIHEKLVRRDDATRTIAYTITEGPFPVVRHEATITVSGDGASSTVTWAVDVEPDDLADVMNGVYQQGLEALKAHLEG